MLKIFGKSYALINKIYFKTICYPLKVTIMYKKIIVVTWLFELVPAITVFVNA